MPRDSGNRTEQGCCWYCGQSERFPWTRWLLGPRLRSAMTFFGFGPVAACGKCIAARIATPVAG